MHLAPVLIGDGIRLLDRRGGRPVRLEGVSAGEPAAVVNVRYHPIS